MGVNHRGADVSAPIVLDRYEYRTPPLTSAWQTSGEAVWQLAGLAIPAASRASLNALWRTDSCRWCRRFSPVMRSVKWLVAGNTHCHPTPYRRLDISSPKHSATARDPIFSLDPDHAAVSQPEDGAEGLLYRARKHAMPVFVPFARSNEYLILEKINVFDSQSTVACGSPGELDLTTWVSESVDTSELQSLFLSRR